MSGSRVGGRRTEGGRQTGTKGERPRRGRERERESDCLPSFSLSGSGGRTPGVAAQPAAPSKAPAPLEPAKRIPDATEETTNARRSRDTLLLGARFRSSASVLTTPCVLRPPCDRSLAYHRHPSQGQPNRADFSRARRFQRARVLRPARPPSPPSAPSSSSHPCARSVSRLAVAQCANSEPVPEPRGAKAQGI